MWVYTVNGKVIARGAPGHFTSHPPAKSGDRSWKIVDEDTGEVIDRYSPRPLRKVQACTPTGGSWADTIRIRK